MSSLPRLLPPVGLFLLGLHLVFTLSRPDGIVADPGTGWHVKLGEWMVRDGRIPAQDPLSWTLPGARWIDYQWGTHAVMGVLHGGGLRLVAAVWVLGYGLLVLGLYRRLLERGVALPLAWLAAFAAWVVLSMHFQLRPHLWTYLLLAVLMGCLHRMHLRERWQDGLVAALLFLPWANLHAGFVAGLVVWGAYGLGEVAALGWRDRIAGWRLLLRHAGWGSLAAALTLANPWGWELHRHILRLLGSASQEFWHEYQPPLAVGGLNVGVFAGLAVLLLGGAAARVKGIRPGEWASALVLLFFAFSAVRHVNLFVIAALPAAALSAQALFGRWTRFSSTRWVAWNRSESALLLPALWVGGVAVAWMVFALGGSSPLRGDLRGMQVAPGALEALQADPEGLQPLVHPENLGGVIAYELAPRYRLFADDRLDYYGDDFFIGRYLPLMRAEPGWREMLNAWEVRGALLPAGSGLAQALGEAPGWSCIWADDRHVLFRREMPEGGR